LIQDAFMSDRKYRQRGYQDEPKTREPRQEKRPPEPRAPGRPLQDAAGPRTPNLMASHEVFKCARCGNRLSSEVAVDARCSRCDVAVHSCINCVSFDTSARWECAQSALGARVSPKDDRNQCALFAPRTTIERQTGTAAATETHSARKAFDDLFK
jgi:hypothetical protein